MVQRSNDWTSGPADWVDRDDKGHGPNPPEPPAKPKGYLWVVMGSVGFTILTGLVSASVYLGGFSPSWEITTLVEGALEDPVCRAEFTDAVEALRANQSIPGFEINGQKVEVPDHFVPPKDLYHLASRGEVTHRTEAYRTVYEQNFIVHADGNICSVRLLNVELIDAHDGMTVLRMSGSGHGKASAAELLNCECR